MQKKNLQILLDNLTIIEHRYTTDPDIDYQFIQNNIVENKLTYFVSVDYDNKNEIINKWNEYIQSINKGKLYDLRALILDHSLNSYYGRNTITSDSSTFDPNKNRVDNHWYLIYSKNSDNSINCETPLAYMTNYNKYVTDGYLEAKRFNYDLFNIYQIVSKYDGKYTMIDINKYSIM